MKVLLIDTAISGHRLYYISALQDSINAEFVLVLPEKMGMNCKQYVVAPKSRDRKRSFLDYWRWIKYIDGIIETEKPDVIHFLYGDFLYKYFGLGISKRKKTNSIVIIHDVREGLLQKISLFLLGKKFYRIVVHSKYLKKELNKIRINNVKHIEYPVFIRHKQKKKDSLEEYGLKSDIPVILCLGATRYDKGLDILLKALKAVRHDFQLLIAGAPDYFKGDFVNSNIIKYKESVRIRLHYLSNKEIGMALIASDIICIPYRKSFNGASGPLCDGVSLGKCIIGPNHGNLGRTIIDNHLGYTFRAEDIDDLTNAIDMALSQDFDKDRLYLEFQKKLDVECFKQKYAELYMETGANK